MDTNRFDLGPLASLIAFAQRYHPLGSAEIHAGLNLAHATPLNGTVTLTNVTAAMPNGEAPPVSDLNGTIRLPAIPPISVRSTFKLGSGNAQLQANIDSLRPVHASYRLNADKVTLPN